MIAAWRNLTVANWEKPLLVTEDKVEFNYEFNSVAEFNSVVWSPQGKQDIECIERVLRRFTKRLPGLKSYPYKVTLKRLNLTTLELRRLHIDLVWCYKIVFGLVDVRFDDFFTSAPLSQTRGHKHKLFKRRCSTNIQYWHVIQSLVTEWLMYGTTCKENITDFNSLSAFKRTIKMIDFTTFLKCDWYFSSVHRRVILDCSICCSVSCVYLIH